MANNSKITILNVDDNQASRRVIAEILKDAGFEVKEAATGQEVLQILQMANEKPDLIILDIKLPDINGFEVCRRIKANPVTSFIPIIQLSGTYLDNKDTVKGLESGADNYLTKPVEPLVLIATIKALLRMHQAENMVIKAAREWQTTFDTISDGICLVDAEGIIVRCNQAMTKILGRPKNEILGVTCCNLFTQGLIHSSEQNFNRLRETCQHIAFELPFNGHWLNLSVDPILDEHGNFIGAVQIITDITERKLTEEELQKYREHLEEVVKERTNQLMTTNEQLNIKISQHEKAENALRESEAKYSSLVEQAKEAVIIIQDEIFKFVNQAATEISGYTTNELTDHYYLDLVAPESKEMISRNYTAIICGQEAPSFYEIKVQTKDGSMKDVEITVGLIQYEGKPAAMAVVRDISEHKRREEEWQKLQRLESIGLLAGGIAHDFNNILTSIIGNLSLAKMFVNPENKVFALLTETEKSSYKARDLTQQLLTFARGGSPIKKTCSIGGLLKDTVAFALRGSQSRCEFSIPDDLWPVEIDKAQISQVIHNLITNADQAMPAGGIIKVIAENETIEPANELNLSRISGKRYIKLSIEDHGVGIPEKYIQRIFDPYFTTKQEGSGLGLATTYSIIKKHEGCITVKSTMGVATVFTIYLPAISYEEEAKGSKVIDNTSDKTRGRILVMDDEESVRKITRQMLEYLGYEVEVSKDGKEMIELYQKAKQSGQPFKVVIMDLTVPGGLGGQEALSGLLEIDREVKAIVSSGYSTDSIMSNFKQYGFRGVIAKPYKIDELDQILREF